MLPPVMRLRQLLPVLAVLVALVRDAMPQTATLEGGYGRKSFSTLYEEAMGHRKAKRYQESVAAFNEALEQRPKSGKAWFQRGVTLRRMGAYEAAVESLDRALVMGDHGRPELWKQRGMALHRLGREEEADGSYLQAFTVYGGEDKAPASVHYNHGLVLDKLGDASRALQSYRLAAKLDPTDADFWFNAGVNLGSLRRHEEAVLSYEKAVELRPDWADAHINMGASLRFLGEHDDAMEAYDRAIEIDERSPGAWTNRGLLYVALEDYDVAVESFDRAIQETLRTEQEEEEQQQQDGDDQATRADQDGGDKNRGKRSSPTQRRMQALRADIYVHRGQALSHTADGDEEAADSFQKALLLDPSHEKAAEGLEDYKRKTIGLGPLSEQRAAQRRADQEREQQQRRDGEHYDDLHGIEGVGSGGGGGGGGGPPGSSDADLLGPRFNAPPHCRGAHVAAQEVLHNVITEGHLMTGEAEFPLVALEVPKIGNYTVAELGFRDAACSYLYASFARVAAPDPTVFKRPGLAASGASEADAAAAMALAGAGAGAQHHQRRASFIGFDGPSRVGYDPHQLEAARSRGIHGDLVVGNITGGLASYYGSGVRWADLVIADSALVTGLASLDGIFRAAAAALLPNGTLAMSALDLLEDSGVGGGTDEAGQHAFWQKLLDGRYEHSYAYVEECRKRHGFILLFHKLEAEDASNVIGGAQVGSMHSIFVFQHVGSEATRKLYPDVTPTETLVQPQSPAAPQGATAAAAPPPAAAAGAGAKDEL